MAVLNPYLNFNGNAGEAFNFYKSVFGREFIMLMRFKDAPPEYPCAPGQEEMLMHVSLPIGNGSILMGSDVPEKMGKVTAGNNFQIAIGADSEAEADKLFNNLSTGGTVIVPLAKSFWGAYFGMLHDKFGTQWMVSYDYKKG